MKRFYLRYALLVFAVVALFFVIVPSDLSAQCPMCRMTAEGNLKEGGMAGKGLNLGILYMLSGPYILFSAIAYIWWKRNRQGSD